MTNKVVIEMDQAVYTIAVLLGITSLFMFTKNFLVSVTKYEPLDKVVMYDEDESEYDDEDEDEDNDTDDEMPPLIDINDSVVGDEMPPIEGYTPNNDMPPLEEVSVWVSKDEFNESLNQISESEKESQKLIIKKIDEFHNALMIEIPKTFEQLEEIILQKLEKSIVELLNKQKNSIENSFEIEILQSQHGLEEKFYEETIKSHTTLEEKIKEQKEVFLPLIAKKELDLSNWQGWIGQATHETTSLKIVIENRKLNTHELNDAWVDHSYDFKSSSRYRDSLIGVEDDCVWKVEMTGDPKKVNASKEYEKVEWDGSIYVLVTFSDMNFGSSAKDLLKKIYNKPNSIDWKRVLIPQTKSA